MVGQESLGRANADHSLVGRELELDAITLAVEHVERGFGQSVVVTGPLGMGKSRLLGETLKLTNRRLFGAIRGSGSLIDSDLAYASIVHGIGRTLGDIAPPERAKLVRGLDSLGLVLEGLNLPEPTPLGDPSLERVRLFESMVRLIDRLAANRPLLMVFDDVQGLDDASLDFLAYLATDLPSLSVLMLVSVDPYEPAPHADRFLSRLRGETACTELSLTPLKPAQVGVLVEKVLDGPLRLNDVEALASATGGNPLLALAYIDGMARGGSLELVQGGWASTMNLDETLPLVAKDIYAARISRLDDPARAVLEIIAIGGGEILHQDLDLLSELDETDLILATRRLESAGMIVTEDRGFGVFHRCSQPAISRAVYEMVPIPQRQQKHATFIELFEESGRGPDALVWHYRNVGSDADQERRLTVLVDASRLAMSRYANEYAAQVLGAALDVARLTDRVREIPTLLEDLGEALQRTGEERAAIEMWREARALSHDASDQARVARRMGAAESNLGRFSHARRHVDTGKAILTDQTSAESVELGAVGTLISFRAGDIGQAAADIDLLRDQAAERPSERTAMNLAMLTAGLALEHASYGEARRQAQQAYDQARSLDDPVSQQQALALLALDDLSLGHLDGLDHHLELNVELTERIGVRLRAYRILLYQFVGDIYAGRWEHAGDVAIEAALLAQLIEESRNRVVLVAMPALLDLLRGQFEQAAARLDQARQILNDLGNVEPRLPAMIEILDAWSDLEAGHPNEALARLERRDGEFLQGLLPPWGRMLLAEAQARAGDGECTVTAASLTAMGPPGSLPWVWSHRIRGMAETDPQTAVEAWDQAATGFDNLHMPFEAARARLHAAELDAPGEPRRVDQLKEGHRLFSRLGASRYRDHSRQLLRSFGETTPAAESDGSGTLSPRQVEVARLVAEGLTNGEIADRLFISRRTVTTHLENIYRQLGISSRTTLTRYVLEQTE